MNDQVDPLAEEPTADEIAAVDQLLARAGNDELWTDPPAGLDDAIVAEIDQLASRTDAPAPSAPTPIGRNRPAAQWWLAAAATVLAIVAGITLLVRESDDGNPGDGGGQAAFALAGTDRAPGASADVWLYPTSMGLKILLEADGLPAAPDGTYYEAWLTDGNVRVSAGTFHARGDGGEIELWAGVTGPEFDRLAVTLEPIDDDLDSSGDAFLRGTVAYED